MVEIYQRDGSHHGGVLPLPPTRTILLQKLFRALFRTNNGPLHPPVPRSRGGAQMAIGSAAMSNTASEVILSTFLLTGSNTTENHPIISRDEGRGGKHGAADRGGPTPN